MNSALLSLIGFSVAMYITPGPNNVMVAASAANNGIRATVPHMFGIATGFSVMLTLVCAGLGSALVTGRCCCRCSAGSAPRGSQCWPGRLPSRHHPAKVGVAGCSDFIGAAAFQWINPEGLADRRRLPPANTCRRTIRSLAQLARIFVVFLAVGMPCLLVWALLGSGAGRLLHSPVRLRAFNIAMALLLVASLVPVLIEG